MTGVKKVCTTVFMLIVCSCQNARCQQHYAEEHFSFDSDGLRLEGLLTIPESFGGMDKTNDQLVILVTPPLPLDRDYYGMYSALADTLGRRGIAVFRFDNRAYTDTSLTKDGVTMHQQARDAVSAVNALRQEPRFAEASIGMLGHSEGAAATAIAISEDEDNDLAFGVFMAPSGINGDELAYYQGTTAINRLPVPLPEAQKKPIFDILRENIRIVASHRNKDSLEYYLDAFMSEQYELGGKEMFGKQTKEEALERNKKKLLTPRLIAYIRFKPALYYSRISCPALVMYGKLDERLDPESNSKGIRKIFTENGKRNYKIVVLDSLDHSFKPYTRPWIRYHNPESQKPEPKDFSRENSSDMVQAVKQGRLVNTHPLKEFQNQIMVLTGIVSAFYGLSG